MNTKKIIFLILIILVIGVGGWYGYGKYSDFAWLREMRKEADKFNAEQSRVKALIEADTYGGVTPQETLQMFIDAVEKGDYELASKYFVVESQGEWIKKLSTTENIDFLLDTMRKVYNSDGYFSKDKNIYTKEKPVFVEFIKYPSDLWKINEI